MYKTPKDSESGLKKSYVSGLSSSTAKARKAHWEKTSKMDPKNPAAYEPAPGDKSAKTKESKYTKAYKAKFGEEITVDEIMIDESAEAGLANKAKESGISLGTLKQVYKRGVAAWRTGHRPGTTPQQWGMARVNSYITKGKTYHTADKDLHEGDGLWANIHAKRKRGERMHKPGSKGAPTAAAFKAASEETKFEKHTTDPKKSSSRFDASDELVNIYKHDTPGQSKTLKTIKKVVEQALYECNGNCTCGKQPPVSEAEYQGRQVPLGKPMKGDVKKSKVYVKDPSTGNVKKVNFGDPNMKIKKNIPARRKSFRARHRCDTPGPRTKARYWSCRAW